MTRQIHTSSPIYIFLFLEYKNRRFSHQSRSHMADVNNDEEVLTAKIYYKEDLNEDHD